MQNAFDFYLPTRLCFGSGARRRLPEQLTRLGVRNLLLCTDKMLRSAGVVEKITSILDGCADVRYTIYDDVTENPGNSVVDNGYALARELGFDDINMDVIAGLPGEDEAAFARTMEAVRRLAPDSLTVHTLAIKRSSRLNLERAPLPDPAVAAAMVRLGEETAEALGLAPYYLYRQKYMAGQQQNVGYARPGAACLYNVDIMEETTSILAMGAGAISKRVLPDRELRIRRAPNVTNVSVYIDRAEEMARRKEILFTQTEGEKPCES